MKDWFEKLPFKSLDLESRIVVTNNHYSHFILQVMSKKGKSMTVQKGQRYSILFHMSAMERYILMMAVWLGEYQEVLGDSRSSFMRGGNEMMRFLNDLPCELIKYEDEYVRTLLEKITVYDNHIVVEFKLLFGRIRVW